MDKNLKGDALKSKACRTFLFSEKQKEMLCDICHQLDLNEKVLERATEIYKIFLKRTLNKTIGNPKCPIYACVYIAGKLESGENYRPMSAFCHMDIFKISDVTMRKWNKIVMEVIHGEIMQILSGETNRLPIR